MTNNKWKGVYYVYPSSYDGPFGERSAGKSYKRSQFSEIDFDLETKNPA